VLVKPEKHFRDARFF
jgi:hypothetical protein